jgi:hypothetical protein
MPRIFSFERELYATLDLVPLTVRRKLDLADLKISLDGWQALPIAARRALADAVVDDGASIAAFVAVLRAAAERAGVVLKPLLPAGAPPWRSPAVPAPLRARLAALRVELEDAAWAGLDDEARYALFTLAEKRREPERLSAALVELGLLPVESRAGGELYPGRRRDP